MEGSVIKYLEHPFIWPNTVEFRLFQKKIADIASEGNTLVILPTALGKTVISAIVSANILYNYRNAKMAAQSKGNMHKHNTVQQQHALRK